ncbi:prolyl 4-hydroxylase [Monoraphidium neglectum]|uniref:Prolyl 4-hydroxylase n=1 Tax=Monoraphidium neglectum TaxID=145388 RepID=A0A0D2K227_9CHLO|nr:prolyl 4-hydroxylase [Monoraphidium neglectum]KIZ04608.1 prolyl 4-hydroxylase [Monoraphidium neglectum]|eukprot:XP_013903627.1 prolyl 4-hydroxylase [Monoraphidium neglectum]
MPLSAPLNIKTEMGWGDAEEEWRGEVIQLSWRPRAFLLKKFLTDEECEHIKAKASDKLEKSGVVDNETGEEKDSEVRTSSGTFFDVGADEQRRRQQAPFLRKAPTAGGLLADNRPTELPA